MKNLVFLCVVMAFLFSCQQSTNKVESTSQLNASSASVKSVKDGVFIHISEGYNDPHKVLMPLKMAIIMAEDKDVLVYMDIHAVELLVKGSEDITLDGFESAHTYLKTLTDKNIGVYACPTCLKVAGFSTDNLLDGIQAANKERFFDFTEGRIITLDY